MVHSFVDSPARCSRIAASAKLSSRPAETSASNCLSQVFASNLQNHSRNFANSSGGNLEIEFSSSWSVMSGFYQVISLLATWIHPKKWWATATSCHAAVWRPSENSVKRRTDCVDQAAAKLFFLLIHAFYRRFGRTPLLSRVSLRFLKWLQMCPVAKFYPKYSVEFRA